MALPAANNAEGGTSGTTVTTANSGGTSGTAFDIVTIGGTGTLTADNAQAAHGTLSYKVVNSSAANAYLTWSSTTVGTQTTVYGRLYFYVTANPTVNFYLVNFLSGATNTARIRLTTTGKLAIMNAANATIVTTANSIALSAWNRVEFKFICSTTTGSGSVSLYPTDSTTATETISTSAQNFGAASSDTVRFGVGGAPAMVYTMWMDSIQVNNTALPGPDVVNVATAGVTATAVFVSPVGGVYITLPGVTATTVFTAPVGGFSAGGNPFSAVGVTAATVFSAPVGAVSVDLPGVTAPVVVGAPVGTVTVPLTLTNNAEGGTNTSMVVVTDTGSGNSWDLVTMGAGSTLVYDNSQTYDSLAYKITPFTNVSTYLEWNSSLGTQTSIWGRFYLYVPSVPAVSWQLVQLFNGGATAFRIGISATGKVLLRDALNTTVGNSTNAIVAGWVRIEFAVVASATVGSVEAKLFNNPDSATPTETLTVTNQNTNTAFTNYRFGSTPGTATVPAAYWLDNIALTNIGYLGPVSVSAKSTAALLVTF